MPLAICQATSPCVGLLSQRPRPGSAPARPTTAHSLRKDIKLGQHQRVQTCGSSSPEPNMGSTVTDRVPDCIYLDFNGTSPIYPVGECPTPLARACAVILISIHAIYPASVLLNEASTSLFLAEQEVGRAMQPFMGQEFGNPSSSHAFGRVVRA